MDAGRTVILYNNVKGDCAACVAGTGRSNLNCCFTRFESGHSDMALGGAVGNLCNTRVAGCYFQRAAVVVDTNDLGITDIQILVVDVIQCYLLILTARARIRTARGSTLGRGCITSASFDIQWFCIVINAVTVTIQTIDLSIAIQFGRRISVSIVYDCIAVIDNVTICNGF